MLCRGSSRVLTEAMLATTVFPSRPHLWAVQLCSTVLLPTSARRGLPRTRCRSRELVTDHPTGASSCTTSYRPCSGYPSRNSGVVVNADQPTHCLRWWDCESHAVEVHAVNAGSVFSPPVPSQMDIGIGPSLNLRRWAFGAFVSCPVQCTTLMSLLGERASAGGSG